ncbi:MAG TPA: hypothetical protein VMD02_06590 [Candidatus Omnitrophota bacterium]|nr:hypothetical protein [Candidatus Omnitrophota bacterium]
MNDSIDYFVKVKANEIYFWCPFFEAFEGMLALRTPEPPKGEWGTLHFMVAPEYWETFEKELIKHGFEL